MTIHQIKLMDNAAPFQCRSDHSSAGGAPEKEAEANSVPHRIMDSRRMEFMGFLKVIPILKIYRPKSN